MEKDLILDGRKCCIITEGTDGPTIVWGTMELDIEKHRILKESLDSLLSDEPYVLAVFYSDGWNDDFSPWDFETPYGQSFGHKGPDTLEWIRSSLIPLVDTFSDSHRYGIAGYSLSGLFAAWAFHKEKIFDGMACCSGSLWFEGWDSFADSNPAQKHGKAYLSLGGKEPGSGNPLTASIGEQYTKERERLSGLDKLKFESNPGGHFSNPVKRMAKGLAWLVKELQR